MALTKISKLHYDNWKPFRLNKNTGEIHNLANEQNNCQLNEIVNYQDYSSHIAALMEDAYNNDGCKWCAPENHTK